MGFFLVTFAMVKLFDLRGFVDGFRSYDLLASRFRAYGYLYPLIEFGLGLAYLAQWQPLVISAITVGVTVVSGLGVILALRRGQDVHCACMGSILKVPLTVVAAAENGAMAAMAAAMLVMAWR